MTHRIPHIDAYGEYQESGSTRAGFFLGMLALAFGAWAAGVAHTKRLNAGLTTRDWRFLGAIFGALAVYVAVMHILTVSLERQTRDIPDFLFNMLDMVILVDAVTEHFVCFCGVVAEDAPPNLLRVQIRS